MDEMKEEENNNTTITSIEDNNNNNNNIDCDNSENNNNPEKFEPTDIHTWYVNIFSFLFPLFRVHSYSPSF